MASTSDRYVMHFGVRVDKTRSFAKISRENYTQVSTRYSLGLVGYAEELIDNGDAELITTDTEKPIIVYTDSFCRKLTMRALKNFDINMARFAALDEAEFLITLDNYVKKHHFKQITDLKNEAFGDTYNRGVDGYIYIMVLGQYKQVYIGITRSALSARIKQHWNRRKPLDRLVFGAPETSRISIDSFGPLDTTMIFAKPYKGKKTFGLEALESRFIRAFDQRFVLNRL